MASSKFGKLAARVGSRKLAGWITQHEPAVHARASATRTRHAAAKAAGKKRTARNAMRAS